jgi:uncharacterized membrane protein YiaA
MAKKWRDEVAMSMAAVVIVVVGELVYLCCRFVGGGCDVLVERGLYAPIAMTCRGGVIMDKQSETKYRSADAEFLILNKGSACVRLAGVMVWWWKAAEI